MGTMMDAPNDEAKIAEQEVLKQHVNAYRPTLEFIEVSLREQGTMDVGMSKEYANIIYFLHQIHPDLEKVIIERVCERLPQERENAQQTQNSRISRELVQKYESSEALVTYFREMVAPRWEDKLNEKIVLESTGKAFSHLHMLDLIAQEIESILDEIPAESEPIRELTLEEAQELINNDASIYSPVLQQFLEKYAEDRFVVAFDWNDVCVGNDLNKTQDATLNPHVTQLNDAIEGRLGKKALTIICSTARRHKTPREYLTKGIDPRSVFQIFIGNDQRTIDTEVDGKPHSIISPDYLNAITKAVKKGAIDKRLAKYLVGEETIKRDNLSYVPSDPPGTWRNNSNIKPIYLFFPTASGGVLIDDAPWKREPLAINFIQAPIWKQDGITNGQDGYPTTTTFPKLNSPEVIDTIVRLSENGGFFPKK